MKAVSRTISAGSPLSSSADSEPEWPGLQFARRHSSAGLRALAWATSSACSLGSSLGSDSRASRDSLRGIVVTPDSIPQFTIPKLAVDDKCSSKDRECQGLEDSGWGSTEDLSELLHPQPMSSSLSSCASSSSSLFGSSPASGRNAHRCASDPSNLKRAPLQRESSIPCSLLESEHCCDPTTRAALSLPHLAKVTTPYGFVTLSQSPQMANEEELFFQMGHRRWAKGEENMNVRNPMLETRRGSSARTPPIHIHANGPRQQSPAGHQVIKRSHGSETKERSDSSPTTANQTPASRTKRSLWDVLRKHLSG